MKQIQLKNSQSGFTLIELVVVIVILGILAATALPKFADLQTDARKASLNAARGSMAAAANLAHAAFLTRGTATGDSLLIEGKTATNTFGYPLAAEIPELAGLSSDYIVSGGEVQVKGAPTPANCKVTYAAATSATVPPTYTVDDSKC